MCSIFIFLSPGEFFDKVSYNLYQGYIIYFWIDFFYIISFCVLCMGVLCQGGLVWVLCGVILRVGCQDCGPFKRLCILTSLDLLYGDMSALHCVCMCVWVCVRVHVRERLLGYAWKTPGMCWCLHFSPLTGSICCSTIDTVLACFSVKDPGGFLHIWQCLVPLPGESRPMRQWLCYSPQPSLPGHLEASWFVSPAHLSPHAFPISICTSTTSSHLLTPAEWETFHLFPHYTHIDT